MLKEAVMYRRRADLAFRWGLLLTFVALVLLFNGVAWAQVSVDVGAEPQTQTAFEKFAQRIGPPLLDLLGLGLLALIGYATTALRSYQGNNMLAKAGVVVGDYVLNATKHLLEGLAPHIKAALADDGKIDANERKRIIDEGVKVLRAELPPWVQNVMQGNFGDGLGKLLEGKVANAVDGHLAKMMTEGPTETASAAPRP